jgi:chromosome segregation ATPase
MFQEKQQIMDYLRQIENDLIEKEQIKQREISLRQDYEQLKNSIHQDQQKIQDLQQQCSQLLKTIQNQNEEKDQFVKQLSSQFHIPIESCELSLDNIIQPIENHFNDLQHQCDTLTERVNELQSNQTGDNEDELQQNLVMLSAQCAQLEEANKAWQEFHQAQLENFRNKFRNNLPMENNISFDEIAQSIIDYLNQLINERDHLLQNHSESSLSEQMHVTPSDDISAQSTPSLINDHDAELRENIKVLTTQCAQLDKANRAWQEYQLAQIDQFRNKLRDYLTFDEHVSFDEAAQLIVDQMTKEREEFKQRYQELEKHNEDLRLESATNLNTIKQSYVNTINELTQELSVMKEELDKRTDDIDQEREQINERCQELEKENRDLRSGNSFRSYPSSFFPFL